MRPITLTRLNQADVDLVEMGKHYGEAIRRLTVDVSPGFPTSTPGSGSVGGGSGGHGSSMTERLADRRHPELHDLYGLRSVPPVLVNVLDAELSGLAILGLVERLPRPAHRPAADIAWSRLAVHRLIYAASSIRDEDLGRHTVANVCGLARDGRLLAERWGYTPAVPAKAKPQLDDDDLAHDPTGEQCRSCLRAGRRDVRYRGDLCQWCYRFWRSEGFYPPPSIVAARASGKAITEQMVAPHRKAHRDRNTKKRKKR